MADDHVDAPEALCEVVIEHVTTTNDVEIMGNVIADDVALAFPVMLEESRDQYSSSSSLSIIANNINFNTNYYSNGGNGKEISSYLYESIRSRQSISEFSWMEVLSHISRFPGQVRFVHETNGRTPLHVACLAVGEENEAPPLSVISAFLELFPQAANLPDASGNLPMHLLFSNSSSSSRNSILFHDIVDLLLTLEQNHPQTNNWNLSKNTKKNRNNYCQTQTHSVVSWRNKNGCTVLDLACDNKDVSPEIIQSLVLAYNIHHDSSTSNNNTPLARYATAGGTNVSVIRLLMDKFPQHIQTKNLDGETILHRPAFYGNINFIESILLRNHDSWNVQDLRDKRNRTPLHRACQGIITTTSENNHNNNQQHHNQQHNNMMDVIDLLLENFPETALMTDEPHGRTPLHYACLNKKPSIHIVNSLLYLSKHACRIVDRNGYTPLHCACANTEGEKYLFVKALLDHCPLATCMETKRGDTPLHLASEHQQQHDDTDIIQSLIEVCPDAMGIQNNYGFNPLHCACRRYQPSWDVFNILLSHKEQLPRILFQSSHNGDLPLHMAVSSPRTPTSVIQLLFKMYKEYNVDNDHDTNHTSKRVVDDSFQNKFGNNPLHLASYQNHSFEFMSMLISLCPKWVLQRNYAGYSPLHICCKAGEKDIRIFKTMLQIANRNSIDNNNNDDDDDNDTNDIDILQFRDEEGHAPIHSACSNFSQSSELVSLLAKECPDAVTMATKSGGDLPLHLACARQAPFFVIKALVDTMTMKSIENFQRNSKNSRLLLEQRNYEGSMALDILMARYVSISNRPIFRGLATDQNDEEKIKLRCELMYLIRRMLYCHRIQSRPGELVSDLKDSNTKIQTLSDRQLNNEFISPDLHTCLNLRKKVGGKAIPSFFLKEIIQLDIDQVSETDPYDGNYPLHLACELEDDDDDVVVVENSSSEEESYDIVRHLLSIFPDAASKRINCKFPLDYLIKQGRTWINGGVYHLLQSYPPAINLWQFGNTLSELNHSDLSNVTENNTNEDFLIPHVLYRVAKQRDLKTLFRIISSNPGLFNSNHNEIS